MKSWNPEGTEPVAVLVSAASALHLKDRDKWIRLGWTDALAQTRADRGQLGIVDPGKGAAPESCHPSSGPPLRALPAGSEADPGYIPLLREPFAELAPHQSQGL